MGDDVAALLLTLATENAELREQLAESQDQCIELAVDSGELHARVEDLRTELIRMRAERDMWRRTALRSPATASVAASG